MNNLARIRRGASISVVETNQILPNFKPQLSRTLRVCLLFAIVTLGILVRAKGVRTLAPNADEHHWVARSGLLLERIETGHWAIATTHLGHPGIPAAAVMAVGQAIAQSIDPEAHQKGNISWFDPLTAARMANLLVSSLAPLALLLFAPFVGFDVALIAAFLLMFDCTFIGLSRIAHIDGILTLLTTLCVWAYLVAEKTGKLKYKFLAGILWGLCISTKPTAAAIVGLFICYRFFRSFLLRNETDRPAFFSWGDVWAVVTGHLVLGALYTKLWIPDNTYVTRHHIMPVLSDYLILIGQFFAMFPVLPIAFLLIAAWLGAGLLRESAPGPSGQKQPIAFFHIRMLLLLAVTLLLLNFLFPIVSANIVRFWGWVLGLSNRKHEAYGMIWEPHSSGYTEIFFRRMSSVLFLGVTVGVYFITQRAQRLRSRFSREELSLMLMLAIAAVIWALPLSVSSKQTIRYVAPVFPLMYVFAAWAFMQLAQSAALALRADTEATLPKAAQRFSANILMVPVAVQLLLAILAWPHYELYFNSLSGGIKSAEKRGWTFSPVGYEKALQKVHDEAVRTKTKQSLEILGDFDLMKYAYYRYYPERPRLVEFRTFAHGVGSDWVLAFDSFINRKDDIHFGELNHLKPELVYKVRGAEIYTLYRAEAPELKQAFQLPFSESARATGRMTTADGDIDELDASPSLARPGYISFNDYIRVAPGDYLVQVPVHLHLADRGPLSAAEQETLAVRIELSSECKKLISGKDLSEEVKTFELRCHFNETARAQFSVYWFGKLPVRLRDPSIQRVTPSVQPANSSFAGSQP